MKKWFTIFTYASIIFLVIYLYKHDLLFIPGIYNYFLFCSSIVILILALLTSSFIWHKAVTNDTKIKVKYGSFVTSMGLSVLGKYIPGKFWTVAGRSTYITDKYQIPLSQTMQKSFFTEISMLWVGILLGAQSLLIINRLELYIPLMLGCLVMAIIIFSKKFFNIIEKTFTRLFKKSISIKYISAKQFISLCLFIIIYWFLLTFGFWLFINSIVEDFLSIQVAAILPLAMTTGLIALFAPGGIGVREGLISLYLIGLHLPASISTSISVSSRIWFIIGETSFFIIALILKFVSKKSNKVKKTSYF